MITRVFFAAIRTLILIGDQGGATTRPSTAEYQAPVFFRPYQNGYSDWARSYPFVLGSCVRVSGTARLC